MNKNIVKSVINKLTHLESDVIELEDAEEMNRANPDTFMIPPRLAREALPVGAVVKILAVLEPASERFWVEITNQTIEDGHVQFYGKLRNNLLAGYVFGSKIGPFEAKHIIDIYVPTKENIELQKSYKSDPYPKANIIFVPETLSKSKRGRELKNKKGAISARRAS